MSVEDLIRIAINLSGQTNAEKKLLRNFLVKIIQHMGEVGQKKENLISQKQKYNNMKMTQILHIDVGRLIEGKNCSQKLYKRCTATDRKNLILDHIQKNRKKKYQKNLLKSGQMNSDKNLENRWKMRGIGCQSRKNQN